MRFGVVRFDLKRPPITGSGFLDAPHILKGFPEVGMHIRTVRLDLQRPPVAGLGLIQAATLMKDVAQIIMRHGIARQQFRRLLQCCQAVLALYLKGCAQYLPGEPGIRVSPDQRTRPAFQFRVMSGVEQGNQLIAFGWCRGMRSGFILATFFVFLSAAAGAWVVTSWFIHEARFVNGIGCCNCLGRCLGFAGCASCAGKTV